MTGRLDILPFSNLVHLGDLVDVVFPTTSVYNSSANLPLIVEWADVAESEGKGDIYYMYQTTPQHLKLYISGRLSHFELIQSAIMNIAYVFKGNINSPSELSIEIIKNLPQTYFPDFDVYFAPEDAFDIETIEKTFNLSNLKDTDFVDIRFRDSLNLHFRQGKNIGFGEGDVKVVGDFLVCFGSLYEEVVTDKHKGIERNKKLNKSQREDFAIEKPLNISGLIAASLSIIVKPKAHIERITFEENIPTTDSEETLIRISNLIKNSLEIEKILTIKDLYNSKVFDKLEKLAENIKENELSIDFKHKSIQSTEMIEVSLNPSNSTTMIANIKRIYEDTSIPEEHEGNFDMLHCGTGHFSFKSNSERFRGYFEKGITDLTSLDFKTLYRITINRTTKKGKQDNIKIIGIDAIED